MDNIYRDLGTKPRSPAVKRQESALILPFRPRPQIQSATRPDYSSWYHQIAIRDQGIGPDLG